MSSWVKRERGEGGALSCAPSAHTVAGKGERMPGYRMVLLLLTLVGAGVGGCLMSRQQALTPPQQQQGVYVGSEVCVACHADLGENLRTTPHTKLLQQASPDPTVHWG